MRLIFSDIGSPSIYSKIIYYNSSPYYSFKAMSITLSPLLLGSMTLAPLPISVWQTDYFRFLAALCSNVSPPMVFKYTFKPSKLNSLATNELCPASNALYNGVLPSKSCMLTIWGYLNSPLQYTL